MLTREIIMAEIRAALEPLDYVYAMWEGGAAAFDRLDQWSDIDLQVDVRDEQVEAVFDIIDVVLERLGGVEIKLRLPEPTWHGHSQAFYRLKQASPYLMLDLAVEHHSKPSKFLEPEIHGRAIFQFDKIGLQAAALGQGDADKANLVVFDAAAWQARLAERRPQLRDMFALFQVLTLKEIERGNWIEALAFYQTYTLRPLVEALRLQLTPEHYNFATRYLYYELAPEVVQRLERLYFVPDGPSLRQLQAEAETWFYQLMTD